MSRVMHKVRLGDLQLADKSVFTKLGMTDDDYVSLMTQEESSDEVVHRSHIRLFANAIEAMGKMQTFMIENKDNNKINGRLRKYIDVCDQVCELADETDLVLAKKFPKEDKEMSQLKQIANLWTQGQKHQAGGMAKDVGAIIAYILGLDDKTYSIEYYGYDLASVLIDIGYLTSKSSVETFLEWLKQPILNVTYSSTETKKVVSLRPISDQVKYVVFDGGQVDGVAILGCVFYLPQSKHDDEGDI